MLKLIPGEIAAWQRGQTLNIQFEFQGEIPEEPILSIFYTDGNDLVQEVSFDILVNKSAHPPKLKFAA
ncbi:hypothetical protein [Desulfocicer vacuolatum]|uniref:hypothetical protein n=1 Tax=Desulfocicer vacuolatum TaxID=2298 RepID=UPI00111C5A79|nr:hypothetical protein [Desulfocicer vacuolatum]